MGGLSTCRTRQRLGIGAGLDQCQGSHPRDAAATGRPAALAARCGGCSMHPIEPGALYGVPGQPRLSGGGTQRGSTADPRLLRPWHMTQARCPTSMRCGTKRTCRSSFATAATGQTGGPRCVELVEKLKTCMRLSADCPLLLMLCCCRCLSRTMRRTVPRPVPGQAPTEAAQGAQVAAAAGAVLHWP